MKRENVIDRLRADADEIRARGAASLYLFGSTARNQARPDSDGDIFFEYDTTQRFSLFDLFRLQDYLRDIVGAEVDLGTKDGLHPVLRDAIIREAIRIL